MDSPPHDLASHTNDRTVVEDVDFCTGRSELEKNVTSDGRRVNASSSSEILRATLHAASVTEIELEIMMAVLHFCVWGKLLPCRSPTASRMCGHLTVFCRNESAARNKCAITGRQCASLSRRIECESHQPRQRGATRALPHSDCVQQSRLTANTARQ